MGNFEFSSPSFIIPQEEDFRKVNDTDPIRVTTLYFYPRSLASSFTMKVLPVIKS
jgi:hypothetical protein